MNAINYYANEGHSTRDVEDNEQTFQEIVVMKTEVQEEVYEPDVIFLDDDVDDFETKVEMKYNKQDDNTNLKGYKENNFKTFICEICEMRVLEKQQYEEHLKECKRKYSMREGQDLQQCTKAAHNKEPERNFKCPHCDNRFNKDNLKCHLKIWHNMGSSNSEKHVKKTTLNCPLCHTEHSNEAGLRYHMREVHNVDIRVSKNSESLKDLTLLCPHCDKKYSTDGGLNYHMRVKHGVNDRIHKYKKISHRKEFKCQLCSQEYSSEGGLKYHMNTKHNIGDHVYTNGNLLREKSFKCRHCEKKYFSEGGLMYHIRVRHRINKTNTKPSRTRDIKCPKCENKYSTKGGLKYHVRVQHNANTCTFKKKRNKP